jgi:small-conductance mechanosensitive channel
MRARTRSAASSVVLFVGLFAASASAQDAPDIGKLVGIIRWGGLLLSFFVIVGAMVAVKLISDLTTRLGTRFASRRPAIQKADSVARFVIYIVTAVFCIGLSVRLDPTAVTVIGGGLAFAIGFAMRDLVAAFIAGITIMFDRPFQVGDRVAYAGEYGDIIKIGLRSVQMNTLDHNIVTIPNNKVLTDVTSSGNYGALEMQVAMDFYIGVDQDLELATDLIREACLTSLYVFLDHPVPVLARQVIQDSYVAIHLKARPYVFDCRYEKPFETDVHSRVLTAFRKHGVHPPAILHRSIERPPP